MKVAICDDQKESLKEIKKLLEDIRYVNVIDSYSDIETFFKEIRANAAYDAVLMDIDWKSSKTGIDFSEELLKHCPYTKIIYVTAYTMDYVEEALLKTANLSGFLMKPVKLELLEKNLKKIRKNREETDGKLVIKYKSNVAVIPYHDIYYVESQLHKQSVRLQDKEYQCSEIFSQLKKRLGKQFLECHRSYIVNMEHIAEFTSTEIILTNGEKIPISKKRYGETKNRFFEYMSEGMIL